MTRHQYGISAFLRRHFAEKPVAQSQNVACALKLLLGPKYEYARTFFLLTDRGGWRRKLSNELHLQLLKSQFGVQEGLVVFPFYSHSWLKIVIFDILLKTSRFMYVRRPLVFVQKQYQWITH